MSVPSIYYRCPCIADFPPCHFLWRQTPQPPPISTVSWVVDGHNGNKLQKKWFWNLTRTARSVAEKFEPMKCVCSCLFFSALGFLHINIIYISIYSNHFISFQISNQLFPFCHFLLLCIARRGWRRSWRRSSERKTRSDWANLFERALWMGLDEWRGWLCLVNNIVNNGW